ncbi:unnamed protein product [Rotaria socialis]|uniref:Uncharacterized protein n=1 Tax=Rotaria socialis TaxID=392032 RepID=A0A821FKT0_9BILA|nr:unnamed protein product [Rotaria socialis]
MEWRSVLNNRSTVDIPNDVLCGQLQQQLKYYKFRRVRTKAGKAVLYLFFRKEAETYYAFRTAASMNDISLVRYLHPNSIAAPLRRPE